MSPMFHSAKNTEDRLSIFDFIEYNQNATFFVRYRGEDLEDFSIFKNDILVIDRSIEYKEGKLAVFYNDEFHLSDKPIGNIWGVVKYVIRSL
jgi:DNA polymerase V